MAIWQFKVLLIPESALREKFGAVPVSLTRELAEEFDWWKDRQPPREYQAAIDVMLREAKSWSPLMRIWGNERGDTAVVCYYEDEKSLVEEIEFRIDVRQLSLSFVSSICAFARRLQCVLVTGENHLLAADESVMLAAINNSTAKRYLQDPVSTLRSLKGKLPGGLDREDDHER